MLNETIKNELYNLIDNANSTLITSVDYLGCPKVKAMLPPRKREDFNKFYFSTNTSSQRVKEYRNNSNASIYFYNPNTFKGVLFTGKMEVSVSPLDKEMIWRTGDTMYYSKGVTDTDYCILIFSAEKGRYYKNFESFGFKIK